MEIVVLKDGQEQDKISSECVAASSVEEHNEDNTAVSTSILALLDDKNKSIISLKRQIQNQKQQLGYYLHRELSSPKVAELAVSCLPDEAEENIQINMAMNKFCKQAGLKSRIMNLYERMKNVEKRTLNIINQQEEMMRLIINKLADLSHDTYSKGSVIQFILFNLRGQSAEVDILAKVAGSTNKLRKELDTFRTCCSRLIVIEEERNSLVEQVYSMPVTQRMSYSVLLAAQYEKLRLEKEVEEIKRDQKQLQRRLSSFCNSESENNRIVVGTSGDQSEVHDMLNAVNAEALSLLTMAKNQREKYLEEIHKLQDANGDLTRQIRDLKDEIKQKECIKGKIDELLKEHETYKQASTNKFNEIYLKMRDVVDENMILKERLAKYCDIEDQVKLLRTQIRDMEAMRKQRDYYKSQVEDLQAIRAAYTQLVELPLMIDDRSDNKEKQELDKAIVDLKNQHNHLSTEKRNLETVILEQELQIRQLLVIIEKLAAFGTDKQESSEDKTLVYPLRAGRYPDESKKNNKDINVACGYDSNKRNVYSQTENLAKLQVDIEQLQASSPHKIIALTSSPTPVSFCHKITKDQSVGCVFIADDSETMYDVSNTELPPVSKQEPLNNYSVATRNLLNCDSKTCYVNNSGSLADTKSKVLTTSVYVQTINRKDKSESMRAVLETSSPMEGLIQMNNSSALTLRLTCNPTDEENKVFMIASSKSLATIISGVELENSIKNYSEESNTKSCNTVILNEFELMKDSSNETLVAILPSLHHQVGNGLAQQKHLEISSNTGQKPSLSKMELALKPSVGVIHRHSDYPKIEDSEDSEFDYSSSIEERNERTGEMGITGRLKQITYYIDQTLSQPNGNDLLLKSVRAMYNNNFKDDNKFAK